MKENEQYDDSDIDAWENFKPLKKRRKIEVCVKKLVEETIAECDKPRRNLRTASKKIAAKVKRKVREITTPKYSPIKLLKEFPKLTDTLHSEQERSQLEFCPSCQVPFNVLKINSEIHVSKCIDNDRKSSTECPEGIECNSKNAEHYEMQTHYTLAKWRTSKQIAPNEEKALNENSVNATSKEENASLTDDPPSTVQPPVSKIVITGKKHLHSSLSLSQLDIRSFFSSPSKKTDAIFADKSTSSVEVTSSKKAQWDIQWWKTTSIETKGQNHSAKNSTNCNKINNSCEFGSSEINIQNKRKRKTCPFYKIVSDSTFAVDAFSYGVIPNIQAYFLSHFHYDHYQGLGKNFCLPIYCSEVTASLVELQLKVEKQYLNYLPLNKTCIIHGIEVILIEANHCPGAVMFYFHFPNGQTILHTGDFRADCTMEQHEFLSRNKIDILYLDTTYCDPIYDFPSQDDTVNFAASLAKHSLMDAAKTLFVCGTYTIGKEKIFLAIAKVLNSKICAFPYKLRILKCLHDPVLSSLLTNDWTEAQVHVLPMNKLNVKTLKEHLKDYDSIYSNLIAIRPTGWEFKKSVALSNIKPVSSGPIKIYGIPYSEHSSYSELKRFVQFLKPVRILPTVNNGSSESRAKMDKMFRSWLKEN